MVAVNEAADDDEPDDPLAGTALAAEFPLVEEEVDEASLLATKRLSAEIMAQMNLRASKQAIATNN